MKQIYGSNALSLYLEQAIAFLTCHENVTAVLRPPTKMQRTILGLPRLMVIRYKKFPVISSNACIYLRLTHKAMLRLLVTIMCETNLWCNIIQQTADPAQSSQSEDSAITR